MGRACLRHREVAGGRPALGNCNATHVVLASCKFGKTTMIAAPIDVHTQVLKLTHRLEERSSRKQRRKSESDREKAKSMSRVGAERALISEGPRQLLYWSSKAATQALDTTVQEQIRLWKESKNVHRSAVSCCVPVRPQFFRPKDVA